MIEDLPTIVVDYDYRWNAGYLGWGWVSFEPNDLLAQQRVRVVDQCDPSVSNVAYVVEKTRYMTRLEPVAVKRVEGSVKCAS